MLTLSFSFATDRGGAARSFYPEDSANRVSRAQIDSLFAFSDELAHDYTGLWTSASTLAITLTNDTCCTHARLGDTMVRVRVRVWVGIPIGGWPTLTLALPLTLTLTLALPRTLPR